MDITVLIKGEIKTKQRPRFSTKSGVAFTPKETIMYENYVRTEYLRQADNYYFGNKPLSAHIVANFRPRDNASKFDVSKLACVNHKDLDNIAKTVLDALNTVAYEDDKQIIDLHVEKKYSTTNDEFITLYITECNNFKLLEELKDEKRYNKLLERYNKLCNKKRNKQEEITFQNVKKELETWNLKE